MAGSYNHLVSDDGSFQFDLIENMGDAQEACEDCFNIIRDLKNKIKFSLEQIKAASLNNDKTTVYRIINQTYAEISSL
jgi:hypothetical protein